MNEGGRKSRPKSQIMMPNTSTSPVPSHSNSRKNGSSDSLPSHRYENEWEIRKKELQELRTRSAQMEKTMRWWSDCTDNWRKKWSEVKRERNTAREELKATRAQLDLVLQQLEILQHADATRIAQPDSRIYSNLDPPPVPFPRTASSSTATKKSYAHPQPPIPPAVPNHRNQLGDDFEQILYKPSFPVFPQGARFKVNPDPVETRHAARSSSRQSSKRVQTEVSGSGTSVLDRELVSLLEEKVTRLKFKLDEVTTRLSMERQEKALLIQRVERLQRELGDLGDLYESLKKELCELNGKEFTESEIESFADEKDGLEDLGLESDNEENRLIEQLAHDNEEEEDRHTPTAGLDLFASSSGANSVNNEKSDERSVEEREHALVNGVSQPEVESSDDHGVDPRVNGLDIVIAPTTNPSPQRVPLLNGELKALTFQEESHEKLDLMSFGDPSKIVKGTGQGRSKSKVIVIPAPKAVVPGVDEKCMEIKNVRSEGHTDTHVTTAENGFTAEEPDLDLDTESKDSETVIGEKAQSPEIPTRQNGVAGTKEDSMDMVSNWVMKGLNMAASELQISPTEKIRKMREMAL